MRYFFLVPLLLLTACAPSRNAADTKLAAACLASVKASFADDKENVTPKSATYSSDKAYDGSRLRVVTLKAAYTYGASEPEDKTYICTYTEEWSLFSWLPEFYYLQKDTEKIGNVNGTVTGDPEVIAKITEANDRVLHTN